MSPVAPHATLGILAGGQLARMMSVAATRMGYRVRILDPDPDCPAALVADETVLGDWKNPDDTARFAKDCDLITLDTEHVPHAAIQAAEAHCTVHPNSRIMATIQDRAAQRRFLAEHKFPAPRTAVVSTADDLKTAIATVGTPSILKTRTGGYDGKGQARLKSPGDAAAAWKSLGNRPAILESFVAFEREISVLVARTSTGDKKYYAPVENTHRDGILHTTVAPARIPPELATQAQQLGGAIADGLGHVGMMAVELFVDRGSQLLVNEIAPRVHNSGHYTIEACATNQFEQHVRAIFGLPLGDARQHTPAAMLNLLGDLWQPGPPDRGPLTGPNAHLHLYGKRDARPGRKMGHVTFLHPERDQAFGLATQADQRLRAR